VLCERLAGGIQLCLAVLGRWNIIAGEHRDVVVADAHVLFADRLEGPLQRDGSTDPVPKMRVPEGRLDLEVEVERESLYDEVDRGA
jgi:hypothetical protein